MRQQQQKYGYGLLLWPVCAVLVLRAQAVLGWGPSTRRSAAAFVPSFYGPQQRNCGMPRVGTRNRVWTAPVATNPEVSEGVSFVQTELRKEAMRLHTRDQAKEGEQEAQTPFTKWEPKRQDYLQFLVDSKLVYEVLEEIVATNPKLAAFTNTGLERAKPLEKDIEWFASTYSDVTVPSVGRYGSEYAALLKEMVSTAEGVPAFMCHYYNFYFAHTAGGRMIGKKMAALLLDDHELEFYKWEGDVKELLDSVRRKIDAMAATWTPSEREACVKETKATFKYGGSLLSYIAGPHAH